GIDAMRSWASYGLWTRFRRVSVRIWHLWTPPIRLIRRVSILGIPQGVAFGRIRSSSMRRLPNLLGLIRVFVPAASAHSQTAAPSTRGAEIRINWESLSERERNDLGKLLESKDWPARVFG